MFWETGGAGRNVDCDESRAFFRRLEEVFVIECRRDDPLDFALAQRVVDRVLVGIGDHPLAGTLQAEVEIGPVDVPLDDADLDVRVVGDVVEGLDPAAIARSAMTTFFNPR